MAVVVSGDSSIFKLYTLCIPQFTLLNFSQMKSQMKNCTFSDGL